MTSEFSNPHSGNHDFFYSVDNSCLKNQRTRMEVGVGLKHLKQCKKRNGSMEVLSDGMVVAILGKF